MPSSPRRVRGSDEHGRPAFLVVAVRGEHAYLFLHGRRIQLTEAGCVALLTAVGEAHWNLATGESYQDHDR